MKEQEEADSAGGEEQKEKDGPKKRDKNADNNITKGHIYPNKRVISEFTIWKTGITLLARQLNRLCKGIFLKIDDCEGDNLVLSYIWYTGMI